MVRVYLTNDKNADGTYDVTLKALYYADAYPADAPVLDQNQVVQMGVHTAYSANQAQPMNLYPACLQLRPAAADYLKDKAIRTKTHMPDCPPELFANGTALWDRPKHRPRRRTTSFAGSCAGRSRRV